MKFTDMSGRKIELSGERWTHIIKEHSELKERKDKIKQVLVEPEVVKRSIYDQNVLLFYRYYEEIYAGKYVCVVVRILDDEGFIITSYITDKIKRGEIEWKEN